MQLRLIGNHITFRFNEEVDNKGHFTRYSEGGFKIPGGFDDSAKSARWATVVDVGPNCKEVKLGDQILIKPLAWSLRFDLNGVMTWRTDEKSLVAVVHPSILSDPSKSFIVMNDFVVFYRLDKPLRTTPSGIAVVTNTADDTANGMVVGIGPEVFPDIADSMVFFNGTNFFNNFKFGQAQLSFITEKEVIVFGTKE